jgi:selenocysteine-specific elongation factor
MKHIIIGTAGHVDHGKTALVRALTGIDTDRLKEEKERGITIELGFAQFTLNNGQKIGIVDVPGHERFVKNMVAGAGGIDLVAMIIAADEGVMPQTREHLDICQLLGIKKGIVALTKIDLVNEEWRTLVKEDIRESLKGTFMETSPVIPVSAVTGKGLTDFISAMEKVISETDERSAAGFFRLPADRVFSIKGFGTVVTGSLMSGKAKIGETVEIMPRQTKARIRGIQIHNETAEVAVTGQRTAINLQGIDKDTIQRGDILTSVDTFRPSARMDIFLKYLPGAGRKLKNRTPVRFHTGTSEIVSRIIFFDKSDINPGEERYAQILLGSPTIAVAGDRFVIRSYSPINTIGGGEILDPVTKKHKGNSENIFNELEILHRGNTVAKTKIILERAGLKGMTDRHLSVRTGIPLKQQNKILEELLSKKEALLLDRDDFRVVSFHMYQILQDKILEYAKTYHEKFPLKEGYSKEELRFNVGKFIDVKLFNAAIRNLENDEKIIVEKENVRLAEHSVNLKGELKNLRENITAIYRESKLTPPATKEVVEKFSNNKAETQKVLDVMLNEGLIIKVNENMYFYGKSIDKLISDYRKLLLKDGKSTPATFRDLTGLSRKFVIPLMEYFDKTRLTIRVGDHRILRERKENEI